MIFHKELLKNEFHYTKNCLPVFIFGKNVIHIHKRIFVLFWKNTTPKFVKDKIIRYIYYKMFSSFPLQARPMPWFFFPNHCVIFCVNFILNKPGDMGHSTLLRGRLLPSWIQRIQNLWHEQDSSFFDNAWVEDLGTAPFSIFRERIVFLCLSFLVFLQIKLFFLSS